MRPIRSGEFKHRITLQRENEQDDGHGGQALEPWTDVATVMASIEPISGNEALVARQLQDTVTHKVLMRWRPGVTAKLRIKFGTRLFEILEVRNWDERNRLLELRCVEGAAT